jgi:Bacterial Ig-like domain (group 3)/Dockerin type I domain
MSFLQRIHLRKSETRPSRRIGGGKRVTLRCEQFEERTLLSGGIEVSPTFERYVPRIIGPLADAATDSVSPAASGSTSPFGVTPAEMRSAYGISSITFGSIVGNGAGQTIAIVDAFDDPNIASDLAAFDTEFDLPAPPSFVKEGQTGSTTSLPSQAATGGWGIEISLDVEWAHVMAPAANILLVEAKSAGNDLLTAVNTAKATKGVSVVSMSWAGPEDSTDPGDDSVFIQTGVTFLAATGDTGADGSGGTTKIAEWPAVSTNVVAVGGTTLDTDSNGDYLGETGWSGSGGGISGVYSEPSWQKAVVPASITTTARTIPDVSIDADPNSGVPIYDSYDFGAPAPWATYGGTSLATPLFSGIVAIANQVRVAEGLKPLNGASQTLPDLYGLPTGDFHDITSGNNGYNAAVGYDLVTGIGSPIAPLVVDNLVGTVSVGSFSASTVSVGNSTILTAANVTTTSVLSPTAVITGVNFYRESNSTAGLQFNSDTLVGAGVFSGTTWTISAPTTGLSPGTYTYYAVATDSAGFTSPAVTTTLTVTTAAVTIGAFGANPSTVFTGSSTTTLTASNVTTSDSGATVTGVTFYRENNGIAGLQTSGDTLVGSGILNANTWTLSLSASYPVAGNYTYYALATDSSNATATASAILSVVAPTPSIGSFAAVGASVTSGATVTLTASNVIENGGSIETVAFYLAPNGASAFQSTDTFLGDGTENGTTWSLGTSTYGFAPGSFTYYAVAIDPANVLSVASSTSITVTANTSGVQTLRIATYNMSADNGSTGPLPGFNQVLEGIGQESLGGIAQPIDILALEETTSNTLSVAPAVSALNAYYGGVAVYAASPYQATQFGSATSGNGPNALVYDTTTLNLLASVPLAAPLGSSNGEYRQVVRYEFQPTAAIGSAGIFYVYVVHSDNGTAASDAASRNLEAELIRDDEATLPASARVLYLGDFEMSGTGDASYQTLTATAAPSGPAQGAAVDPLGVTGSFSINTSGLLTNSPSDLASRSDLELASANAFTSGGLDYVAGSYSTFGNDGSLSAGASVSASGNDALTADLVQNGGPLLSPQALLGDLSTASTHLPVVADFTVPLTAVGTPGIAALAVSPSTVSSGGAITLTASGVVETGGTVTGVEFYRETNGVSGLQIGADELVGAGVQNGTTWTLTNSTDTIGLVAGSYTYYAVATDSNGGTSAVSSTSLAITTPTATPVIGSLTAAASTVTSGTAIVLSANNVAETGGTISSVTFYRDTNGVPGLQTGGSNPDTRLGLGVLNGTIWTFTDSTSTTLPVGAYTYFAIATDASNVTGNPVATSILVTPAAAALVQWNMVAQTQYGTNGLTTTKLATGITNTLGLTRGIGVGTQNKRIATTNAWGGASWDNTVAQALTDNRFVTFGFTVASGQSVSLGSIGLNYRSSGTGPTGAEWQYEINNGAWNLIGNSTFVTSASTLAMTPLSLSGITGLQNLPVGASVEIRIIPFGAEGSGNTWYIANPGSTSSADLAIYGNVGASTTVALTDAGPAPSLAGQAATFNIQVAGASPTGPVALEDADNGDAILGTATLSGGSATISVSSLGAGTHHLIAVYAGDTKNAYSQSTTLTHIVLFGDSTMLTTSAATAVFGQPVTLTATVANSSGTPTGTVEFLDGTTILGVVGVGASGIESLGVSNLAIGSHSITAVYSGDANFAGSTSSAQSETVSVASTSTSVQSSEPTSNVGDSVTFTAQVAATSPGGGIPTGTVQFAVDGSPQGSPVPLNAAGQASLTIATLSMGPHLVSASYGGDSNFAVSTSVSISQAVDAPVQVASVVVNGDHLSPIADNQRSEVTSILYTFNQAVTLTTASFEIAVTAGQTGTLPTLVVTAVAGSGNTEWLVTFTGAGVNNATESIADGVYDITLIGADVLGGAARMAGNRTDTFFRLMGDLDGNGTVDSSDFNILVSSFLRSPSDPAYIAAADLDGNGTVDGSDFNIFVSNFLRSFTGFSATI